MRTILIQTALVALLCMGAIVPATATTFDTSSPGVFFSVNDAGFYVRDTQIPPGASSPGLNASAYILGSDFLLSASGPVYSDAGIVLYFDGGLRLGNLQSVSVASTGSPLVINLWFDTGGNGRFFAFGAPPNDSMTSLNGDSYGTSNSSALNADSSIEMIGGNGAGGSYTLAQLQAGAVAGIDGNTPVALWIGLTDTNSAEISAITADSLPEPASLLLVGLGLAGLSMVAKRIRK
jgi:hypothetical protein